jgi:pyruvate formate lyase activating enzyme
MPLPTTERIHWRDADFYRPAGDALCCTLCPHACTLADGELGLCRVRRRRGDRLETATFATSVRHLDPVERKPLYHYRPGSRALTLAAPGCTFGCHYCLNYRLSQYGRVEESPWSAQPIDPEDVIREAAEAGAAVALSYSEPTLAAELTLVLATAGRERGVDVLWKTNGFITPEALDRLLPCLAAVNLDIKAADDAGHRALTGAPLGPVLNTFAALVRAGVWVEVSTPLIPRVNADDVGRLAEIICRVSPDVPWHLLRFTPDFRMARLAPTSPETLRQAADLARTVGVRYVYVERALGPEGRTTRCPSCAAVLVARGVWSAECVGLMNGVCADCGRVIPGQW